MRIQLWNKLKQSFELIDLNKKPSLFELYWTLKNRATGLNGDSFKSNKRLKLEKSIPKEIATFTKIGKMRHATYI